MSHNLWKNSICERMIVERQIIFQYYNENNFDLADSLKESLEGTLKTSGLWYLLLRNRA